ncbi:MAG: M50 family metallopeptidase [Candidatus Saccharimonadales bacterium]|nr:M50 family metallopeptidase [Candidatus Saccharimonadales bacterium]
MFLVLGLILFVILIVVHEYGHFLVAKRNGVEVEEFGIGFPPKIGGKKLGKGIFRSYYSLNLLPLGGFVRLKGESDEDKRPGSFGAASLKVKTKITLAGVIVNFIAGAIIFSVLSVTGMPVLIDNQVSIGSDTTETLGPVRIGYLEENSPAEAAGLQLEDTLISFDRTQVTTEAALYDFTVENAGETVTITYERDGQESSVNVLLNQEPSEEGYLGVVPYQISTRQSTYSAPLNGVALAGQFGWETLKGIGETLGNVISGDVQEAGENVSGPVGIFVIFRNISDVTLLMMFIGLLSVTLAVMNSLPIPALDGGRLAVMYLFRAIKKPLSTKTEQAIHSTGMVVLLFIIAVISVVDVNRFF